jgi:transposase
MRDMVAKGRGNHPTGTRVHFAKLDADKVSHIKTALASKTETINQLAERFGVSFQAVYRVARGKAWNEVSGPMLPLREVRHLSVAEVIELRQMAASGMRQVDIAKHFGIHQAVVSNIVNGKKRKDVPLSRPEAAR